MAVAYDPFAEEVMRDPHPVYARLRVEAPCYHVEKWDCWALSRFDDIWAASMDAENYSTAQGTTAAHLLTKIQPVTPMLNLMDPPQHTKLRAQIRKYFMPARVNALQPQIQQFVEEAFAPALEKGEADLYNEVGQRISVKVACLANGFPVEDADMLNELVKRFFGREEGVEGMTQDGVASMMEMTAYFAELIKKRRDNPSKDGSAVDTVLQIELDGRKMSDEEAGSHLSMFLIGGAETFPKVLSSAVYLLYKHPDQRAECAKDPSLLPDAFTEVLRHDMPTQFLCRTLRADVALHGETMRKGRPVLFLYPSANRDESEFENPDVFDIHRRPPRILSFGHGIHACIGAHFARMEGKLSLEHLLGHAPEYEIDESGLERIRTEFVQGWATMPARLTA
ncbi:MAG: cytochrome P450 [Myxococcota bacterium]